MADPSKYRKGYSFTGFQSSNPATPLPAQHVDGELADVERAVGETIDALKDIRRSDGRLNNGIVSRAALAPTLIAGFDPARPWEAGVDYRVDDTVFHGTLLYVALEDHESGVFADDLAAGRWLLLADFTVPVPEIPEAPELPDIPPQTDYLNRTAAENATIPAVLQHIRVVSYAVADDGGGTLYTRVAAEPAHAGKLRTLDRFLPNGATDAIDGGWWELAGNIFAPEMFGAVGDGVTDDTAAVQSCFDTAAARVVTAEGVTVQLSRLYGLSSQILLTVPLSIVGTNRNAGFRAVGTWNNAGPLVESYLLRIDLGGITSAGETTITAVASYSSIAIQVADASGFAVNDWVYIRSVPTGLVAHRGYSTQLTSVSGNILGLADPTPFDILDISGSQVRKTTLVKGLHLQNILFDGTGNASLCSGIRIDGTREATVKDIRLVGFNHLAGDALIGHGGLFHSHYGSRFEDIYIENCGNWNLIDETSNSLAAINFQVSTNCIFRNIQSYNNPGFAVDMLEVARSEISEIRGVRGQGRGIKFHGCCDNNIRGVTGNRMAKTGVNFSGGSSYNSVFSVEAHRNGEKGLWSDGSGNINNTINGLHVRNNPTDIHLSTGTSVDTGWKIRDLRLGGTAPVLSFGAGTLPDIALQVRPYVRARCATGPSSGVSTNLVVPFDTELEDRGGNFTPAANGFFTAPTPGYYFVSAQVGFTSTLGGLGRMWIMVNGSILDPSAEVQQNAGLVLRQDVVLYLSAGDTVQVQINVATAARTIDNSGNRTFLNIAQLA